MKRNVALIILFALVLATYSCAPMFERPRAGVQREAIVPPPVDPSLIEERLNTITKALQRQDLSTTERTVLYSLQEVYQGMKTQPSALNERQYYRDAIRKLFYGLSSLEDLYLSRRPQLGPEGKSAIGVFSEKTDEILDAYLSGNYKAVIDQCIELKNNFGPDALTPEIGLVFALSLAHQGMVKDAIAIGEQIANKLQTRPDLVILRAHLAQWHLKMGDKEGALRNYEKLEDLLDERERVRKKLAASLGPIPIKTAREQTREIEPPVNPVENAPETQEAAVIPLNQFLAQIQNLIQDRKFEKARDLIKRRRHQTTSREELEKLSEAIKEVDAREDEFLQERISVLSEQSQVLREAESLIEEERYEEALSKLSLLSSESVDNVELSRLKNSAITGIINRERNKAARLFLAAKNCEDQEKKERYLRSCLEILKSLVDRFPASPLIYKVKDHIQRVTMELEKLG